MKREEALRQIEEEIAECDKGLTNQGEYLRQGCRAGLLMGLSIIKQIDEPKLNWTSYCETCSHNNKLPPYCDKCKNHELVPYGWDYDKSRESITGA